MKTSKIGDLNFRRFKTEIYATEEVVKLFEKEKVSLAYMMPQAWAWYDSELLEAIDENGDGKPDKKFGFNFKVVYFNELNSRDDGEEIGSMEKKAILVSKIMIKGHKIKYSVLKT